jgi:hypothetical protein
MPISLAEKGDRNEILEFLRINSKTSKPQKTVTPEPNTSIDVSKLTNEQMEKLILSMYSIDNINLTFKH